MSSWEDRRAAAEECLIPWIEASLPLAGKTVLEYGCGNGPVSCAFGARDARHLGFDIDRPAVEHGRARAAELGLPHVELRHVPVEEILDAVAAHAGEVDVFLFYAVLEHMSVSERLEVLELARRVVREDGAIVICETPNRLVPWDWHSSQLPFLAQLPDELALRYYDRSARAEFVEAIAGGLAQSREAGQEALTRFGRGMSFHELELVFGDLTRHVLASNWEPVLLPRREIHAEELMLARVMEQARPDLAPAFSRYWLDVILSATPIAEPPPMVHPWALQTRGSRGAAWTGYESIELATPDDRLAVTLPAPTRRLVVGLLNGEPVTRITVTDSHGEALAVQAVGGDGPQPRFATLRLLRPERALELGLDRSGLVTFVGYER